MGILRMSLKSRYHIIIGILCLVLPCAITSTAQSAEVLQLQEKKIKAGLLYNFLKYTYWPQNAFLSPQEPFQLCLLGGDSFEGALDPLQGRTAQQRPISIQKIDIVNTPTDCDVVFIHQNLEPHLPEILSQLSQHNVLTVSDIPEFSHKGGMVEFSQSPDLHIQILVNYTFIKNAGLSVGEELIKLGKIVN